MEGEYDADLHAGESAVGKSSIVLRFVKVRQLLYPMQHLMKWKRKTDPPPGPVRLVQRIHDWRRFPNTDYCSRRKHNGQVRDLGYRRPGALQVSSAHVLQECQLRGSCLRYYTGGMCYLWSLSLAADMS